MMLSANEKALLMHFRKADESGKRLIEDLIFCCSIFGEPFLREIESARGNKDAMKSVCSRWMAGIQDGQSV